MTKRELVQIAKSSMAKDTVQQLVENWVLGGWLTGNPNYSLTGGTT